MMIWKEDEVKKPLLIIAVCAVITAILAATVFTRPQPVEPATRPFLCLTPYSLSYCHAHQDQMYRENALRAR